MPTEIELKLYEYINNYAPSAFEIGCLNANTRSMLEEISKIPKENEKIGAKKIYEAAFAALVKCYILGRADAINQLLKDSPSNK